MSEYAPTISIRLPDEARARLDAATRLTRRSRSYLMKEALDRYLGEIESEEIQAVSTRAKSGLLALEGKGARSSKARSREEIDSHIRWLRDNG
jgi:predicted DNA-binding protein